MDVPRRSLILVLIAVLLAALVTYALWPSGEVDTESAVRHPADPPDSSGESGPPAVDAGPDDEAQRLVRRARQLGESRQSELRELAVSQHRLPHDVPMEDYKAALWSDIQLNPPAFEQPGDPELDAETAYRQYMFFGMCSMSPRTGRQADRQLAQLSERAERARGGRLRALEYRVDQTIDMYELCSRIPPDVDPRREAMLWMAEAVRLGHEIAQVQYYEKIMGFLLRPDPFTSAGPLALQQSALIGEFKATARLALNAALEKGHPEAWLAMSRALFEGVVYPRDPVAALAHARVAGLEARDNHIILRGLEEHQLTVAQFLDRDQLAEAEELVLRLRTGAGG